VSDAAATITDIPNATEQNLQIVLRMIHSPLEPTPGCVRPDRRMTTGVARIKPVRRLGETEVRHRNAKSVDA
jgi:hypothetical protein